MAKQPIPLKLPDVKFVNESKFVSSVVLNEFNPALTELAFAL